MNRSRIGLVAVIVLAWTGLLLWSIAQSEEAGHVFFRSQDMKWTDPPPSMPPGARISLLQGDLSKAEPFTFRAKLPPNYVIAPHTHPGVEHVTVLSGTFYMGAGERMDTQNAMALTPGSFAFFKAGDSMFAWTKDEAVIQVHGMGPWGITYINPQDDPRSRVSQKEIPGRR